MKRLYFLLLIFLLCGFQVSFAQWQPDVLGDRFEYRIIDMPDDYEGKVSCALVRCLPEMQTEKAVLYIHGFNDYFFQDEQALWFSEQGYAFFAVDLRKYGRAYLPHQKQGNIRDLKEYYADVDTCLSIISSDYPEIILLAHSTGGLIASVYTHDNRDNLPVDGIILNSPFLDMNFSKFKEKIAVPIVSFVGSIFPNIKVSSGGNNFYAQSIHKDFSGEWDYDLKLKPDISIPVSFGWTKAIHKGHKKIHKGTKIPCPILVMNSDKSVKEKKFSDKFKEGDAVLDVKDIHKYASRLGADVTIVEIEGGLHDLVLSRKKVREKVYETMELWLKEKKL